MLRPVLLVPLLLLAMPCLLGAVRIEGVVLRDDTGAPLVSAEVRIAREGDSMLAAHLETDREGRFLAENLPAGRYSLVVAKSSFLEVSTPVPESPAPLQVRLIRLASIAGTVRTRDGEALRGVRVFAMERTRSGAIRELRMAAAVTSSGADGSFRLRGLPPGNYVLAFSHQGSARSGGGLYPDNAAPRTFELKGGEVIEGCDLIADGGGQFEVRGRVQIPESLARIPGPFGPPGTTMAARFSVGLAPVDQPVAPVAWTRTEEDGSFVFPAIPWGSYELFAAGPIIGFSFRGNMLAQEGGLAFGRTRLQVSSGVENLAVAVDPPRTARLVWQQGRNSVADCPKALDVRLVSLEAWGSELERTVTLPLGEAVTVENLAPARYAVEVASRAAPCSIVGSVELDLRVGELAEPLVVNAAGSSSLSGEVQGREPGAVYQVLLLPLGAAAGEALTMRAVDGQGRFRFESLRPGRYGVGVRRSGDTASTRSAKLADSLTEIELLGGPVEILLNAPFPEGAGDR